MMEGRHAKHDVKFRLALDNATWHTSFEHNENELATLKRSFVQRNHIL